MTTSDRLIKKHAKSFYWAGVFLTRSCFNKCSQLYDFCRTLDNIADQINDLETKKAEFSKFKSDFLNREQGPIIQNIWRLIQDDLISIHTLMDLFDGIESDLKETVCLSNEDALHDYAYRVGGTVGLMMAKILNVHDKEACKGAIDLGIAMQLTNIARDVVEDKQNNRVYIEHSLESIHHTLRIAEDFYDSAFNAIQMIPIKNRFAILVARRVYRKIGRKILTISSLEEYNKNGRTYVTKWSKVFETLGALADFISGIILTKPSIKNRRSQAIFTRLKLDEKI